MSKKASYAAVARYTIMFEFRKQLVKYNAIESFTKIYVNDINIKTT
jgi:hypothetical protein